MKVLIACEESQTVCKEMRKLGHEAYSCDIQEPSGGHPEWHILGDVLPLINGNCTFTTMDGASHDIKGKWDLLIAHPPCTYLTSASSSCLKRNGVFNFDRFLKGLDAKEFFLKFYYADCDRICIENPAPIKAFALPSYTQIVQPYMFGESATKRTCFWLIGLPELRPTNIVDRPETVKYTSPSGNTFYKCWTYTRSSGKARSKTFPGIAKAMAEQWTVPFKSDDLQLMLV